MQTRIQLLEFKIAAGNRKGALSGSGEAKKYYCGWRKREKEREKSGAMDDLISEMQIKADG